MLKFPKNVKYKSPHLYLSNKGLKGIKKSPQAIIIKTKQEHLMSPQQREICRRILAKPVRENTVH